MSYFSTKVSEAKDRRQFFHLSFRKSEQSVFFFAIEQIKKSPQTFLYTTTNS